ncbi:MAG: putative replicase protein [Alehxovirus nemoriscola]|uniref:RNA-directed RNA polymerase n=1 Tax=Leviviridae sp. TaxID=2027243 RepID=A0ABY3SS80_9VIRU|nr:MAG: putative replicase protein [Leviviridae sp.]
MNPNSYADYLLGLYSAMLVDIADKCPHLRVDSDRDYKRLLSAVDSRGIQTFLVDLPEIGKHFDRCLAEGQLTRSGLPLARPYKTGVVIPRLFKGLLLSVFNSDGVLRVDPDVQSILFLRQLYFAAKRFRMDCPDSSLWKTVDEFFKTDQECRLPTSRWFGDDTNFEPISVVHLCDNDSSQFPSRAISSVGQDLSSAVDTAKYVAQWASDLVSTGFGGFDPLDWRAKHGPGAVSDLRKGKSKYFFPTWSDSLETIFPYADMAFSSYQNWVDLIQDEDWMSHVNSGVPSAKMIAVPKTLKTPRLIASEPVAHQWCQQTILAFLVSSIKKTPLRYCIDFSSQLANGSLALRASHTGSHATIDLSAASDRISCWVVERVFRRNPGLLRAFRSVRTRFITNEIDKKSPSHYELRKFSTMGSALTFPVQTIIFSILSAACVNVIRQRKLTKKDLTDSFQEVRVFGDDIIVPTDCWALVQAVLEDLGLKVNPNKTFGTGKFRESCGCDAYDGHDVTKVAIISKPDVSRPGSIMSAVDTHNNFLVKGYYRTAAYIKSTVIKDKRYLIPDVVIGSGIFGWYYDPLAAPIRLKTRWNQALHRIEVLVHSIESAMTRAPIEGRAMVLQYFSEVCKPPVSREERLGEPSFPALKLRRRWVLKVDEIF